MERVWKAAQNFNFSINVFQKIFSRYMRKRKQFYTFGLSKHVVIIKSLFTSELANLIYFRKKVIMFFLWWFLGCPYNHTSRKWIGLRETRPRTGCPSHCHYGCYRGTVQRCFKQRYSLTLRLITAEASVVASVVGNCLFVPRKSSVAWWYWCSD